MSRALLVQYRPAIRVYKLAWVLRKLGHGVCIVYDPRARPIEEHAWMARTFPHVPAASPEEIDVLAEGMDVVFHFNTDIAFTDGAAGHPGYALYVGDIGSVRERSRAEKTERETRNLRRARGVIFCSEEQARVADEEHGPLFAPRLVLHNGPVEEMLLHGRERQRLSAADGKVHVVYSGTMTPNPATSRHIQPLVDAVAGAEDLVLHLIGAAGGKVPPALLDLQAAGRLVIDETVSTLDLIPSLSRFDVGLIYVNPEFEQVVRAVRPNKLYEYLAAGLPVVTVAGSAAARYLTERGVGVVIEDLSTVREAIEEARSLREAPGWPPPVETYESQGEAIQQFLDSVLGEAASSGGDRTTRERRRRAFEPVSAVREEPAPPERLAARILASLPWPSSFEADVILLAARTAAQLATLDAGFEIPLRAQLSRLRALGRPTPSNGLGWGLASEYDTFSDGQTNPASTIYSYTTAAAALAFLDGHAVTGSVEYLQMAQSAATTLVADLGWWVDGELAGIWYSDQRNDRRADYLVYNVCALGLAVLSRLDRALGTTRFARERADLASLLLAARRLEPEPDKERWGDWPYRAGAERRNDLIHEVFVLEGLLEHGSAEAWSVAVESLGRLYAPHFASDGCPNEGSMTLGSQGWGPGAGLFGFASTSETLELADRVGPCLSERVGPSGEVAGTMRDVDRGRAWYALGLARWAAARAGAIRLLPPPVESIIEPPWRGRSTVSNPVLRAPSS